MLAKPNRLRKQQEFTVVHKQGLRRNSVHLTLKARLRQPASIHQPQPAVGSSETAGREWLPVRFGISISQKVSKRSTVRNRIKRQLRAACRQLLPRLPGGWDLVIVVRPGLPPCDYHQFLQELEQLLVAAELLHGH